MHNTTVILQASTETIFFFLTCENMNKREEFFWFGGTKGKISCCHHFDNKALWEQRRMLGNWCQLGLLKEAKLSFKFRRERVFFVAADDKEKTDLAFKVHCETDGYHGYKLFLLVDWKICSRELMYDMLIFCWDGISITFLENVCIKSSWTPLAWSPLDHREHLWHEVHLTIVNTFGMKSTWPSWTPLAWSLLDHREHLWHEVYLTIVNTFGMKSTWPSWTPLAWNPLDHLKHLWLGIHLTILNTFGMKSTWPSWTPLAWSLLDHREHLWHEVHLTIVNTFGMKSTWPSWTPLAWSPLDHREHLWHEVYLTIVNTFGLKSTWPSWTPLAWSLLDHREHLWHEVHLTIVNTFGLESTWPS